MNLGNNVGMHGILKFINVAYHRKMLTPVIVIERLKLCNLMKFGTCTVHGEILIKKYFISVVHIKVIQLISI